MPRLLAIKYPLEYRQDDMSWWSSRATLKVIFMLIVIL